MGINFTNVMKDKTAYLSMAEIDTMLKYCYEAGRIRDYMIILTLVRTGRRVSEITGTKPYTRKVGLRPCDIMPDGLIEFDILKKAHIKTKNKTGQERSPELLAKQRLRKMPKRALKPVDDKYLMLLKKYVKSAGIRPHQRIFGLTSRRVRYIIAEVAKKCKITRPNKQVHPHNFRHSYAIHLLKDNPNDASILKQVQELLDHSDINVTMHYAQFTQTDKKESLNKLFEGG